MLIISRTPGEKIEIGSDIVIQLVEVRGNKCRLGIDAPEHVRVYRREVAEAIRRNGQAREVDIADTTPFTATDARRLLAQLDAGVISAAQLITGLREAVA